MPDESLPAPDAAPAPRFHVGGSFLFKGQPDNPDCRPLIAGSVNLPFDLDGRKAGLHWLFTMPGAGRPLSVHDDDIEPIG